MKIPNELSLRCPGAVPRLGLALRHLSQPSSAKALISLTFTAASPATTLALFLLSHVPFRAKLHFSSLSALLSIVNLKQGAGILLLLKCYAVLNGFHQQISPFDLASLKI